LTGNEVIHEITTHSRHELRIDMEDFEGHTKYAKYSVFSVGDEASEFDLTVQSYSGDAGMIFNYYAPEGIVNGRSMNRLRTNALQNVQQHGCQPEIN